MGSKSLLEKQKNLHERRELEWTNEEIEGKEILLSGAVHRIEAFYLYHSCFNPSIDVSGNDVSATNKNTKPPSFSAKSTCSKKQKLSTEVELKQVNHQFLLRRTQRN